MSLVGWDNDNIKTVPGNNENNCYYSDVVSNYKNKDKENEKT